MKPDKTDLRILKELQADGRLSIVELGQRVSLSPTACQRRVKQLEAAGIIAGYRAVLDRGALGLGIEAFVQVNIERQSKDATERFEDAIQKLPEIRACYVMTGDLDFLLHVHVAGLEAFSEFAMRTLIALPGVKAVRSSIVLQSLKPDEGVSLRLVAPQA